MNTEQNPSISWDWGTGYDLFVSLYVLHDPKTFGLRPSWAAGVRSRLSPKSRDILEKAQIVCPLPLIWVSDLPAPKDADTVLWTLRNLPPEKRLPALAAGRELHQKAVEILKNIARKEAWTPGEKRNLKEAYQEVPNPPNSRELQETIEIWVESANFGEQYLEALQEFYEAFYSEEESRIEKALKTSLETAQKLAEEAPFSALIETLSRGIRLDTAKEIDHWTLVPSYWISPLVVYRKRTTHQGIFMFGGRPEDESLVPGAQVPESMLRALKTLADPTRLRILRYLSEQTLTSSELARRLRLRAPTVTYHLNQLRLAGLVILTLTETNQKQYTTRKEAIQSTMDHLSDFLYQSQNKKA